MTISIEISPHIQRRLEHLASNKGQPVEAYVHDLIENSVQVQAPLDIILAPFRQGFAESGITEDEGSKLFDAAIHAVRAASRTTHK